MLTEAQVRSAVACAVRAPSLHNSQPWLFTQAADSIDVHADPTRFLREADPLGRESLLSCGGAVRHLVLGLRAQGLTVDCALLPGPDPELVAVVTVTGRTPPTDRDLDLFNAIRLRHTDRSRFSDTPVPPRLAVQLSDDAELHGCFVHVLDGDDTVELAVLTEHADQILRTEPTVHAEQLRWSSAEDHPLEGVPVGAGSLRGSPVPLRFQAEDADQTGPHDDPPAAEHPTLMVLSTETDDRLDWIRAGWALSDLLLTLTSEGLVASPLTQALEVPGLRSRLRTALRLKGSPQMVLRVGYPLEQSSVQTGRRPLGEVLS